MGTRVLFIARRASVLVFQQVFIADHLHGQTGADQWTEYWFRRTNHNSFLLTAIRVFTVGTCQLGLYGWIVARQIFVHFFDWHMRHAQRFTDLQHTL